MTEAEWVGATVVMSGKESVSSLGGVQNGNSNGVLGDRGRGLSKTMWSMMDPGGWMTAQLGVDGGGLDVVGGGLGGGWGLQWPLSIRVAGVIVEQSIVLEQSTNKTDGRQVELFGRLVAAGNA
jgi:hypothetical protein